MPVTVSNIPGFSWTSSKPVGPKVRMVQAPRTPPQLTIPYLLPATMRLPAHWTPSSLPCTTTLKLWRLLHVL